MEEQTIVCAVDNCEVPVKAITKGPRAGGFFKYCFEHSEEKKAQFSGGSAPSGGSQGGASGSLGAQVGNALKLAVQTALERDKETDIRSDFLSAVLAYAQNYMEIGNTLQGEFGDKPKQDVPQV